MAEGEDVVERVKTWFEEYADRLVSLHLEPDRTSSLQHVIDTGNAFLVSEPLRQVAPARQVVIDQQVDEMMRRASCAHRDRLWRPQSS